MIMTCAIQRYPDLHTQSYSLRISTVSPARTDLESGS
jgi:hypothetical protein